MESHTVAHIALVAAGVILSAAGQMASAWVYTRSCKALGQGPSGQADLGALFMWPFVLPYIVALWVIGITTCALMVIMGQEPPDDDGAGGAA